MSKLIIPIVFSCVFSICNISTKIEVTSKATATKVKPGYYLKEDDSTFTYKGDKYLIITNEEFDEKGNLVKASVAGDVGYSTYTQRDFNRYKNLINEYSFTKMISVELVNNSYISINGGKFKTAMVDKIKKEIYYNLKGQDTLYRFIYR